MLAMSKTRNSESHIGDNDPFIAPSPAASEGGHSQEAGIGCGARTQVQGIY